MGSDHNELIRASYGSVARAGLSSEQAGVRAVAEAFGYSAEELSAIPAEANMGLSCGNPTAFASLRAGDCRFIRAALQSERRQGHDRLRPTTPFIRK